MTNPTNRINPYEDITVRSKELEKKERKERASKPFEEVIDQIDERRRMKDDEVEVTDEEKSKKNSVAHPANRPAKAPVERDAKPLSLFDLVRTSNPRAKESHEPIEENVPLEEQEEEFPTVPVMAEAEPEVPLYAGQAVLPQQPDTGFEAKVQAAPQTAPSKSLQEIIDQIVNKVYTVKESDGQQEIVVELKGRFDGARLIVKDFDFAKKEMNITIDHLQNAADQDFLMMHKQELIDKLGKDHQIVVHIFTATTADELPRLNFTAQEEREFRREPEEEKKRQHPEKEDETEEK